jgi:RecA-family ATPase
MTTAAEAEDIITYRDIPQLPRIALWPKHLYRGTVTMIAGEGGSGKGLIGVYAAAVVTRGALFAGEDPDTSRDRTPGSVLGIWPEDDPNEDLAYRLPAALAGEGANLDLVYDMTETEDGEPFDLNNGGADSVARLRAQIDSLKNCDGKAAPAVCSCGDRHDFPQYPVLLVVIDPLLAVADSVSTNRQARRTMRPLMRMAKETGVAVLLTHHTVKDGKIASSKGLTDVLRLVFVTRSEDPGGDVKVLSVDKSNNLGPIGDMRYQISGTEQEPYIEWIESQTKAAKRQPAWRDQEARRTASAASTLLAAIAN